jgi:hypothetical protein
MATDNADPWVGTAEIARTLDCPRRRVQRTFEDPSRADEAYGRGNWTDHAMGALSVKKVYAVRRSVVLELASGTRNVR